MTIPLAQRLRALQDDLTKRAGRREFIRDSIRLEELAAAKGEKEAESLRKAVEVIQAAAEARREELRDRVEAIVTRGLRAVFARQDLEFFFRVSLAREIFGVAPAIRSKFGDRTIEADIVDGHGGGIADVVSFILRVLVLCLTRPRSASFLALDETFRHVSLEYLRGCATLLKELNRSAGIQFILVTHKPELMDAADVIYRVENVNGRSIFHLEHDLRDESFHQRAPKDAKKEEPSAFEGQDLTTAVNDATPKISETTDILAQRQRGPRATRGGRPPQRPYPT